MCPHGDNRCVLVEVGVCTHAGGGCVLVGVVCVLMEVVGVSSWR